MLDMIVLVVFRVFSICSGWKVSAMLVGNFAGMTTLREVSIFQYHSPITSSTLTCSQIYEMRVEVTEQAPIEVFQDSSPHLYPSEPSKSYPSRKIALSISILSSYTSCPIQDLLQVSLLPSFRP